MCWLLVEGLVVKRVVQSLIQWCDAVMNLLCMSKVLVLVVIFCMWCIFCVNTATAEIYSRSLRDALLLCRLLPCEAGMRVADV